MRRHHSACELAEWPGVSNWWRCSGANQPTAPVLSNDIYIGRLCQSSPSTPALTCANGVVTQGEVYFPNALRYCEGIYEEPPDRLEAAQARLVAQRRMYAVL